MAEVREKNKGADSAEEDSLLDEADHIWDALTVVEESFIRNTKGPYYEALIKWITKET